MKTEIDKLKSDILSDDWEKMIPASNRIFEIGGQENINYLINLLDNENSSVRNAVALTFRDNKYNEAIEPLLKAINKIENVSHRGTMVYALETMDCKVKFRELFILLFNGINNWEVQNSVLTILDEQEFEFSEEDLRFIKESWDSLKDKWNQLNFIDEKNISEIDIDRNVIQNYIDEFLSYLKEK